jgi:hypothetical protein
VKQRLYLDTSVFGGYFDEEFALHTVPLFNRLQRSEFILLFSTVTQDELLNAPEKVKELVKSLKAESTELLDMTDEAVELANEYIVEGVVGQTSFLIVYILLWQQYIEQIFLLVGILNISLMCNE